MSYQPNNRTILFSHNPPNLQSHTSAKQLNFSISFPKTSKHTRQEFKAECDINTIMGKYMRTGELPHVNLVAPQYFDASGVDFQTHMNAIAEAKSLFAQLPSSVRNRFYNDPGQFVDFCSEPANRTEMAQMGLLSPDVARSILNPPPPTATTSKTAPAPAESQPAPVAAPAAGA